MTGRALLGIFVGVLLSVLTGPALTHEYGIALGLLIGIPVCFVLGWGTRDLTETVFG